MCFSLFHSFQSYCTITANPTFILCSLFKEPISCCPAATLISTANTHPGNLLEGSSNIFIMAVSLLVCGQRLVSKCQCLDVTYILNIGKKQCCPKSVGVHLEYIDGILQKLLMLVSVSVNISVIRTGDQC